ncbi:OLC1v1016444C1 [Oldenlandia corymbosa var. corymbosa]|uniref:NAD(P)H-quinone oxidoreductase subunit M, chloroplastic n=1 Tax=Oldenlandia corymbosa var. corymbosa TaxID=529605 RepID=A0AAV1E7H9_OLDCO|nr:OLC1v1016444C1 [Oldenlandia corymbosa var. corymbosa]
MAAGLNASYMASTNFSMVNFSGESTRKALLMHRKPFTVSAQQADTQDYSLKVEEKEEETVQKEEEKQPKVMKSPRPVEPQTNVKSKNMGIEFGSEWLSSTTRHVRIYAAYIDPETCAFDQTQTDKLTLILDPTDEFVWTEETCNQVYSYFQELIDHYEGADLTEYTLRLIGSDIEHYIRKMLYRGEIQYNMNARVLNFSMGKPRVGFAYNDDQIPEEYL